LRVAPFGDDVTVSQNYSRLVAALSECANGFAKRFAPESLIMREFEIARRFRFALHGKINSFLSDNKFFRQ
jgi:hypothetical protein